MIYDSRTLLTTGDSRSLVGFAPYGLEEFVIPDVVKEVPRYTFEFDVSSTTITPLTIKTIKIPDSITGQYGFTTKFINFNSLETISFPETPSFSSIPSNMFSGCTNLKNFTVNSNVSSIDSNAFNGCSSITSITVNRVSGITISADTFQGIATGGTLYHVEGSDYSTWLSNDQYYLGYYLWNDGTLFDLLNVSTYILQFSSGATGSSNAQSVFINATRGDYQLNVSDNQSQTASTQSDWVVVSGTPSAGNVEFKIYPSTTAQTQRVAYIHIVEGGRIWATITVEHLPVNDVSFQLENVSTYYLQYTPIASGSGYSQSVFVMANKSDYQVSVSDVQNLTGTGVTWLAVSGTPASGSTEFKVYPTTTAETQRNCWVQISYSGEIYATISVTQLETGTTGSAVLNVTPKKLVFSGAANNYSAQTLTVTSTVPYTFTQGADWWFTVSGTPNVGYSVLQVYPTSNNWNNTRSSYIQFYYEGGYKNVVVEQYRANKPRIYHADTYFMATKLRESNCNGQATVIIPASGGGHDYYFTTDQSWITVGYNGGGPASAFGFSGVSSSDYAVFYNYVPEDNDTGRNRSATLSFFYDGELITAKTVYQRAFGFHTNICGEEGCEEIITVDASATSYTFTVTSTTSFYCKKFADYYSLTATCDGYTIVSNPKSSSYNPSAGTHTVTVSFPTGIDGQGRLVGSLEFAQNRGDFTGSTWNWYQVSIRQLGNLNTGKYISATTTTITASSAAQTVTVPGFACNTFWGGAEYFGGFYRVLYGYDYCTIIFEENTTGQQRSDTYTIEAEPVCDDGTGWLTPKTLSITVTQSA